MSRLLKHYASCRTAFFCCDIQEKLSSRISNFDNCVWVSNRLTAVHNILGETHSIFVVTEQYPEGVGPTARGIQIPVNAHVFAKTQNSMLIPEVLKLVDVPEVEQVVLWGNETHVCLLQTAAGLLDLKKKVVVLADGSGSQWSVDHDVAVNLLQSWWPDGCYVSTSESVILQLLKDTADPKAKALIALGKSKPPLK